MQFVSASYYKTNVLTLPLLEILILQVSIMCIWKTFLRPGLERSSEKVLNVKALLLDLFSLRKNKIFKMFGVLSKNNAIVFPDKN